MQSKETNYSQPSYKPGRSCTFSQQSYSIMWHYTASFHAVFFFFFVCVCERTLNRAGHRLQQWWMHSLFVIMLYWWSNVHTMQEIPLQYTDCSMSTRTCDVTLMMDSLYIPYSLFTVILSLFPLNFWSLYIPISWWHNILEF